MFNFEDRIDLIFKTGFFNFQLNFSRALALPSAGGYQTAWHSRRTAPRRIAAKKAPSSSFSRHHQPWRANGSSYTADGRN